MDVPTLIILVIVGVLVFPLMVYVHCGLERIYVLFGQHFCKKHGLTISRVRCGPEFDEDGLKTESSLVEFDCIAPDGERQFVQLRVWIFGVRKVLRMEPFPEEWKESSTEKGQQCT
jgi:hypothetical protein